ncbi:MAG: class I SAM-dependent methyltransferase, partial [Oscillospiraceae bacterium]|nr:class I SAM-dependent methyltransferase [Oscillospiraceae bacterium]
MNENWDAKKYEQEFDFVYRHGEDLLGLLELEPGEKILDLGCGNGVLSKKIADLGAFVVGVDASEDMLALARNKYPELSFFQKDASNFTMPEQFDAVFSNAVFHWIDNQDGLMESIRSVLRPGGRLVCEFGGYGNCQRIHKALEEAFWEKGLSYRNPFYFPTVGAYAGRLEAHGFLVRFARIFNRKTKLEG